MEQGLGLGYRSEGPSAVRLVWIYPDLLSTYGDRGNLLVLARRARLRGIPVEIAEVNSDQRVPVDGDIYLMGGGEDLPQVLAARRLRASGGLSAAVSRGAVVFAVCAGYRLTGFENHQGVTRRGPEAKPLATVVTGTGNGDGTEGAYSGRVVGTYLHGPALVRNPGLADLLLGWVAGSLPPIDPGQEELVAALRGERLTAARASS
jgi:CobQ-like glutamine amidotransferase family enzyme